MAKRKEKGRDRTRLLPEMYFMAQRKGAEGANGAKQMDFSDVRMQKRANAEGCRCRHLTMAMAAMFFVEIIVAIAEKR